MDNAAEDRQCLQCGKQIITDVSSGDLCIDCAPKTGNQRFMSFRLMRLWTHPRATSFPLPFVTLFLIAINVALFGVITSGLFGGRGARLEAILVMNGQAVIQGQWWRLLTSVFLQVTFSHLIWNVLFLCSLGWIAEEMFGHAGLLSLWFGTGIAGSVALLLLKNPWFDALGSSGVVFGLVGSLLGVYFFRDFPISMRSRYRRIAILTVFTLLDFLGEWFSPRGINLAHAGGFVVGSFLGLALPAGPVRRPMRMLAVSAVTMCVLAATAAIATNRQKAWLELDDIQKAMESPDRLLISKLEHIVAQRPDILEAHLLLGKAFQEAHRDDEAIREYQYIVSLQPMCSEAWFNMGFVFVHSKRYAAAADAFSRQLQLLISNRSAQAADEERESNIRIARFALANAYEASGNFDGAVTQYNEILKDKDHSANYDFAAQKLYRIENMKKGTESPYRPEDVASYCQAHPTSFYGAPGSASGVSCSDWAHQNTLKR